MMGSFLMMQLLGSPEVTGGPAPVLWQSASQPGTLDRLRELNTLAADDTVRSQWSLGSSLVVIG